MQKLEVFGANKLKGQIKISGSKNASLPILAATLLSSKKIFLNNLPNVKDIETMINLLQSLGSKIKFDKQKLIIDNSKQHKKIASYSLVKTMRAGILVLGPLLAKFGSAKVSLPGGCAIGTRPVDIHLKALSKLGVKYKIIEGYVHATAPKGLIGSKIRFSKISVGATENLIIAASLAKGTTILSNCAIEPEIKDLVNFLIKAGCNIKWIAKRSLKIVGVNKINETTYPIMFDRIEAGTYLVAAAVTEGNLKIKNVIPSIIQTEINTLKKIGAKISTKKDEIHIIGNKKINSMNIKTAPYPGFPTDLQAQIMVLLCKANKKSLIKEDIFENRFMHVAELNRMGAQISTNGNKAIIEGNIKFAAAELMATDLRASVSLILAALTAKGKSVINRIYHLDRGYESIEKKLKKVGAKIRRELMDKKYLAQIIATDNEGLQMISACTAGAKVKVADIKYLASNKVFLISIERTKIETDQEDKKINSICRFDFVDKVKSKNIDQKNDDLALDLIAIDYLKNKDDYEINLIFDNNAYIALTTETIEVRLEDQNEIKE